MYFFVIRWMFLITLRLTMLYSSRWRIKLKIGTLHTLSPSIFAWYFDMIAWSTSNSIIGQNQIFGNQYFVEVLARDENIQLKTHKLYTLHGSKWVKNCSNYVLSKAPDKFKIFRFVRYAALFFVYPCLRFKYTYFLFVQVE